MNKASRIFLFLSLVVTVGLSAVQACVVPVFRYALERWEPDNFEINIFHKGKMTPEETKIANELASHSFHSSKENFLSEDLKSGLPANLRLNFINLNEENPKWVKELWEDEQKKGAKAPWVSLNFPMYSGVKAVMVSQPLKDVDAKQILFSSARKEIATRIKDGQTAIWVLVNGTDAAETKKARKVLTETIKDMEKNLSLPDMPVEEIPGWFAESQGPALKIDFHILELDRNTTEDRFFLEMLTNAFPELQNATGPVTIPIFGRGRALFPFSGDAINRQALMAAGSFLVGMCSCTIKADNPGVDMLITTDWNAFKGKRVVDEVETPNLTGLTAMDPSMVKTDDSQAQTQPLRKAGEPSLVEQMLVFKPYQAAAAPNAFSSSEKSSEEPSQKPSGQPEAKTTNASFSPSSEKTSSEKAVSSVNADIQEKKKPQQPSVENTEMEQEAEETALPEKKLDPVNEELKKTMPEAIAAYMKADQSEAEKAEPESVLPGEKDGELKSQAAGFGGTESSGLMKNLLFSLLGLAVLSIAGTFFMRRRQNQ